MWILCFTVIFALPISLICETYIEVGDNLFRLPIVISYIGPVECGTIDCDDEDGFYSIGAIELAKKYINNRKDLHYFHNLNITLYNTLNNAKRPVQMTVDAVNDPSSIGIIGFMEMCTNEAAIAGVYNKIGIAHSCSSDIATKDGFSRSFIQLSPSPKVIGQSTVALLYHYNWSHVSLLSPVNEITSFYQRARDYLIYQLQSNNISIIEDQRIQINRLSSTASYADQFTSLLSHSRIIIVLDPTANCFVLRQLLYSKYETLLDGEHAIVGIISSEKNGAWMATSNSESKLCPPAFHEDGGANLTQSQLHALYQNLLVISDSAPPEWSDTNWRYFRDKISAIRHHLPCPPYCLLSRLVPKANYHWARTARLYDSLILLAEAGREALDSGIDIRYGTQYYEYLISRHYKSITGEEEYLNGDGLLVGTLQVHYCTCYLLCSCK
ncbi:hypothetical protein AB6A40_002945 [Gnathostoma spinigerum]|uniref:Receptor ligand binding region domain-containing protein n=1 Tax=Gnathostoma spinigerum TaxID=75299 RepID=A0ABD6E9D7_9BILA